MKKFWAIIMMLVVIAGIIPAGAEQELEVIELWANKNGLYGLETSKEIPGNGVDKNENVDPDFTKLFDKDGYVVKEMPKDCTLKKYGSRELIVDSAEMYVNGVWVRCHDLSEVLTVILSEEDGINRYSGKNAATNVEKFDKVHEYKYRLHIAGTPDTGKNARSILIGWNHETEYYTLFLKVQPKKDTKPTEKPTAKPTKTAEPTKKPAKPTATPKPTEKPTAKPTKKPAKPTATPKPTEKPTEVPTEEPVVTPEPTPTATPKPTATPEPTATPTPAPEHDDVVLPPFEPTPAPEQKPDPQHDDVVLPWEQTAAPVAQPEPEKPATPASTETEGQPDPDHEEVVLPWG